MKNHWKEVYDREPQGISANICRSYIFDYIYLYMYYIYIYHILYMWCKMMLNMMHWGARYNDALLLLVFVHGCVDVLRHKRCALRSGEHRSCIVNLRGYSKMAVTTGTTELCCKLKISKDDSSSLLVKCRSISTSISRIANVVATCGNLWQHRAQGPRFCHPSCSWARAARPLRLKVSVSHGLASPYRLPIHGCSRPRPWPMATIHWSSSSSPRQCLFFTFVEMSKPAEREHDGTCQSKPSSLHPVFYFSVQISVPVSSSHVLSSAWFDFSRHIMCGAMSQDVSSLAPVCVSRQRCGPQARTFKCLGRLGICRVCKKM